jgi:hypothetical protein
VRSRANSVVLIWGDAERPGRVSRSASTHAADSPPPGCQLAGRRDCRLGARAAARRAGGASWVDPSAGHTSARLRRDRRCGPASGRTRRRDVQRRETLRTTSDRPPQRPGLAVSIAGGPDHCRLRTRGVAVDVPQPLWTGTRDPQGGSRPQRQGLGRDLRTVAVAAAPNPAQGAVMSTMPSSSMVNRPAACSRWR